MLPQYGGSQSTLRQLMDELPKTTLDPGTILYLYPSPTSAVRELTAPWQVSWLSQEHFADGVWPKIADGFTPVLTEDPDHHDSANAREIVIRYYPGPRKER